MIKSDITQIQLFLCMLRSILDISSVTTTAHSLWIRLHSIFRDFNVAIRDSTSGLDVRFRELAAEHSEIRHLRHTHVPLLLLTVISYPLLPLILFCCWWWLCKQEGFRKALRRTEKMEINQNNPRYNKISRSLTRSEPKNHKERTVGDVKL